MKKILYGFMMLGLLSMTFFACKKQEDMALLHSATFSTTANPALTTSANSVVLTNANDSQTVVTFKWGALDYGVTVPVTYTLQIDVPSDTAGANGWANGYKAVIAPATLQKSFLGTDFNKIFNQIGLPFGSATSVVVRIKADVNQTNGATTSIPTAYSLITMTVNPYKIVLIYPKLYVAGDFLNPQWTQKDQAGWVLASVKSDNIYEGYVNFTGANNNFKFCSLLSWNGINYGWGGTATTMSPSGSAGNLYTAGPLYARVVADVTGMTVSYVGTSWTVAGDFNGWNATANPMTFNPATNQWTITGVSLTAGQGWKFVGDPSWNTNFGLDTKGNLAYNGPNIAVAKTGTYTITLDLSGGAGNYFYTLK